MAGSGSHLQPLADGSLLLLAHLQQHKALHAQEPYENLCLKLHLALEGFELHNCQCLTAQLQSLVLIWPEATMWLGDTVQIMCSCVNCQQQCPPACVLPKDGSQAALSLQGLVYGWPCRLRREHVSEQAYPDNGAALQDVQLTPAVNKPRACL